MRLRILDFGSEIYWMLDETIVDCGRMENHWSVGVVESCREGKKKHTALK